MNSDLNTSSEIGVVVIGRNEGERLHRCLASLSEFSGPVVYVDSGSTDGSVAWCGQRERMCLCWEVMSLSLSAGAQCGAAVARGQKLNGVIRPVCGWRL